MIIIMKMKIYVKGVVGMISLNDKYFIILYLRLIIEIYNYKIK